MRTGVIIPVANEENTLGEFINELKSSLPQNHGTIEVIFITDVSSIDRTVEIAADAQANNNFITHIHFKDSTGVVSCYLYGYKYCRDNNYDYCIEMDSGFSHPPKHISEIITHLEKGYDCVFMSRFLPQSKIIGMPAWRRAISRLGTLLPNFLFALSYTDTAGGFKGCRLARINPAIDFPHYVQGSGWQIQFKVLCKDLKCLERPYTYTASQTTFKWRWLGYALQGLINMRIATWINNGSKSYKKK